MERKEDGRQTDCHLEKIYGRTIAAQKPFRRPRKREGGRAPAEEALTDSVADKFQMDGGEDEETQRTFVFGRPIPPQRKIFLHNLLILSEDSSHMRL